MRRPFLVTLALGALLATVAATGCERRSEPGQTTTTSAPATTPEERSATENLKNAGRELGAAAEKAAAGTQEAAEKAGKELDELGVDAKQKAQELGAGVKRVADDLDVEVTPSSEEARRNAEEARSKAKAAGEKARRETDEAVDPARDGVTR